MGAPPNKVVVQVSQSGGDCVVAPHECHAHAGDEVAWQAPDGNIKIWVPDESVFEERELMVEAGKEGTLIVRSDAAPGRYPYAIFGYGARDFAHGSSHPIMIIDPGPGP
jgi:plastocyanin